MSRKRNNKLMIAILRRAVMTKELKFTLTGITCGGIQKTALASIMGEITWEKLAG